MKNNSNALKKWGTTSWYLLGIIALVVVISIALGAISGIVVPLIIAIIISILLQPIEVFLEKRGVSAALATSIAMLASIVLITVISYVVLSGFIKQLPQIFSQLAKGWHSLLGWAHTVDIDPVWLEQARGAVGSIAPKMGQGLLGAVSGTFSSVITLSLGAFFALFFLFFALRDGAKFAPWFAKVTGLNRDLIVEIDSITRSAFIAYFKGTAVTALITAPIFILPLIFLKVPLIIPIFVMYFFLSFVPYIGAWITGFIAILIAFGSGGSMAALIVALSLLVSNGPIQNAVFSWALGSSLRMHAVLVLIATIVGGAVAGILGMVIAPPLLAAIIGSITLIRSQKALPRT